MDAPSRGARHGHRVAALLVALGASLPAAFPSHAVGIGGFEVQSSLGQRLRMVVQVTARPDELIDATCFKVNPFSVASDGLPQLTSAQISLERSGDQSRLVVISARPLNDPIVRVSLDVGCSTTLRRDLTLLLDPPPVIANAPETTASAATGSSAAAGSGAPAADSTRAQGAGQPAAAAANQSGAGELATGSPAGAVATAPSESRAAPPARSPLPRRVERAARSDPAAAQPPAQRRDQPRAIPRPATRASDAASRPPAPSAATRAAAGGQRDRLTIAAGPPLDSPLDAPLTPRLTLSTSLSDRSGQPPMSESALGILRQKQARLRAAPAEEDIPSLEAELVVLQKKAAELRAQLDKAIADVQAIAASVPKPAAADQPAPGAATPVQSVPETQLSQRSWFDARTLFAGALALLIALLVAVLITWARRERAERRRQERWNQSPYVPATQSPGMAPPMARAKPKRSPIEEAIAQLESSSATIERTSQPDAFTHYSAGHAASQLGVSDLAQATEKASVFMTLGRHEQAIDTLRDHIDQEPKPSPMAWLMLLDLYRQLGKHEAFTEIAERFHHRFNAETPKWDLPNDGEDAGLVAFPRVIGYIRQDWPNTASLAYLENLLHDNRGGSRIGFSLAAFRDLLLLHSILEEYRMDLAAPARTDPITGELMPVPIPDPPSHLARAWLEAPAPPPRRAEPKLELDISLLATSPDCSAIERGLPVVAEAIIARWGKPGAADYLTNLISLSKDDRNSDVSSDMMSELLMLQEVASTLEETSELGDLSFR
jgi:hypothetical protein